MKKLIAILFVFSFLLCGCTQDNKTNDKKATVKAENSKITTTAPFKAVEKINHYVLNTDVEKCASDEVKETYKRFVDAIYSCEKNVYLSDSYDDNLYALVIAKSNPAYFVVKDTKFSSDKKSVTVKYKYKPKKQKEVLNYIDNEYLTILNDIIKKDYNDLDKILAVYHYFSSRIEYDYDWLDGLNMSDNKYLYPDIAVYQALKSNKGVCHSYAYLCHYAFQQLGIKSFCVTGDMKNSDEGHMWLLVEIDGKYYHIDPTWDRNQDGTVSLRCFGLTDKERAEDIEITYNIEIDENFGKIHCKDNKFKFLRDVDRFDFDKNGKIKVTLTSGEEKILNTKTISFE